MTVYLYLAIGETVPTQVLGIDCSVWNGNISNVLVGKQFAFARASIGSSVDKSYYLHLKQMKTAKVVTGAYHYLTYGPTALTQAKTFINTAKDAQMLAMDIESTALKYPNVGKIFIAEVRKLDTLHRPILLYSSEGTWPGNLGQDANWVAHWGTTTPPQINWTFWQYRGSPLDLDMFHGTLAELKAFVAKKY